MSMDLMIRRPYRQLLSMYDALDDFLNDRFIQSPSWWREQTTGSLTVPMDFVENDDNMVIRANLPGLEPEDVEISITDHALTIKGEYETEKEDDRENIRFRERHYGKFQRSVQLPRNIDADGIEAEFDKGVLKVTLPKNEEAKPRLIDVKERS